MKLCEVYSVYHNQNVGSEVVFQVDMLLKYNSQTYLCCFIQGVFIGRYAVRFEYIVLYSITQYPHNSNIFVCKFTQVHPT